MEKEIIKEGKALKIKILSLFMTGAFIFLIQSVYAESSFLEGIAREIIDKVEVAIVLIVFLSMIIVLGYFVRTKMRLSKNLEKSINWFILFIIFQLANWGFHLMRDAGFGGHTSYEYLLSTASIVPLLLAVIKLQESKENYLKKK